MKKGIKIFLWCAAVFAVLAGVAGFVLGRYYVDNKMPNFSREYVLFVRPDMTAQEVMDSINAGAGTVRVKSLERAFAEVEAVEKMKPGRYIVKPEATSIYVARMLVFGWQTPGNLVLSGTMRTKERIAQKIGSQMMTDSASVMVALNDEAFLAEYGFTPANVFGLILPDTYQMYWTASVKDIFDRLKKEYDSFWTLERLDKAKTLGLTKEQVSVLASIVNGETLQAKEYPIIAGVYLNRYRKGMKLQADPTIAYIHNYEPNRILKKHLKVDSPYNTYMYKGLPPTPINVPPKACIEAVLNPDKNNYIYFCASPEFDGTHRFAVGYTEHLKNAREFQRALTKRQKEKAAAE